MATKTPASDFIEKFCEASGFATTDILSTNEKSRQVVTTGGGKYRQTPRGKVLRLSGPNFPNEVASE